MADLRVEIIGVREELMPTTRGEIIQVRVVEFMVGPHGPFRVRVPVSEFEPTRVRELVEQEAGKVRQLLGV
jgi:RNA polymerase-interacting CarD/CdnL/TRCF family regulator